MKRSKGSEFLRSNVLGLVAIFLALSGSAVAAGSLSGPVASTSAVSNAKFKKLKQRVAALEGKLNGQARGDLQGTYPNLTIAPGAVTRTKIADNEVTRAKIADAAIDDAKLADSSVGARALKQITTRSGTNTTVNAGTASSSLAANCTVNEEPISVGGFWSDLSGTGLALSISSTLDGFGGPHTRLVNVANASGTSRSFTPLAWCLTP